ncbi:MAG TPA: hypothetical protein VHS31_16740 [Tepidisphaeraceae bacterium]|jgi:hypothetical protein|nr:hypothetical protein [Tepidisphaeraceae bacterium]
MAKAKKSETSEPKTPKKAPAKKKAAPSSGSSMVDTTLAAQNAARLLVAGHKSATSGSGASPESGSFKNMKQGLSKPHLSGLDSLLNKSGPADGKKSNAPFGGNKQVGHNQTFGADVNRTGVPRRTGG